MMRLRGIWLALVLPCLVPAGASAQQAAGATEVGKYNDWATYVANGANGKVCYILSQPTESRPAERRHGDVYFFVSSRPADGVDNEASVLVGYTFAEGSNVEVDIDGTVFTLFTKDDGAWVENPAEEARLIAAMRAGSRMTVRGQSQRGTNTSYTFSLSGVTASSDKMRSECSS